MIAAPTDDNAQLVEEKKPYDFRANHWLSLPYFSRDYGEEVFDRWGTHTKQWDTNTPIAEAIWTAYRVYHGLSAGAANLSLSSPITSIMQAGEFGEFLSLAVNRYRKNIREKIALITQERVAWDPQASTSDSASAKQVSLCRNILDYAARSKLMDQKFAEQQEMAEVCGSGFQAQGWDARLGLNGTGDFWSEVFAPWEVCHERVRTYENAGWHMLRRMERRMDWVAHFAKADPEKAEKIATLSPDKALTKWMLFEDGDSWDNSDQIPVLYVYAGATKSCPGGRISALAGGDIILQDAPMPYGAVGPITRLCANQFLGTSMPYANSWSMLPIQEALTVAMSAIMTRLDIGAVPDVVAPDGVEIEQGMLGGANLLKKPNGYDKIELLDLLQIPNALPATAELLGTTMDKFSGINGHVPTDNITSGSMAALAQTQAVQIHAAEERAFNLNLEATGTNIIRIIQRMATEEQMISIAGQDEQWTIQRFKGEDLNQILRVAVKTTSAIMKTLHGRKDIADQLLNAGLIEDPRQYKMAIETGNLNPLFRSAVDQLTIIKQENERILRGEPVQALEFDHHALHVRDHMCELSTETRYSPRAKEIIAHIMEHIEIWGRMSREAPDMLEAIGCPPLTQAYAAGQQAMQMAAGVPPTEQPSQVPPMKMPGAAEQKSKPGPRAAPPGREQSQATPEQPKPSQVPRESGDRV